ncbi:hypothetical protein [Pseudobacteroides cellulosolvens]|uniref:Uncharacterized protein n=1 Tax=Pseudobacteroides cellulosolvens ATCC 35603 = DSM 2933 TaxID=398512 RepID=A0A0L6JJZ3_9FIRM|nr:hypothetical protein [Pseudobacteroides cellulosolvens]KNY26089.1 hypothetical protein Bccel_1351 [Pseudobacteroides cellulosolvens ATCC 35603 = DSM 2933]
MDLNNMDKRLRDYNPYEIYKKWYGVQGYFSCFFRSTPFVSLKHYPDFTIENYRNDISKIDNQIVRLIKNYDLEKSLILVETTMERSIEAAYGLYNQCDLKPVFTFNHIYHAHGIIGTKMDISLLMELGAKITGGDTKGWAFFIDSRRYGEERPEVLRKLFNNQYELTYDDLPPAEMLKDLKYERIIYFYTDDIKEDVDYYINYINENGLEVIKYKLQGEV